LLAASPCGYRGRGEGQNVYDYETNHNFLLAVCLNASANGFSQKVSLKETNAPLDKVFREIKKQSDYTFVYTKALLKKANTGYC
jgi:hypothetical protein